MNKYDSKVVLKPRMGYVPKVLHSIQSPDHLCNCKQSFLYQILSSNFLLYQILISCNKMEINYIKIIQCDFFFDSVSHS